MKIKKLLLLIAGSMILVSLPFILASDEEIFAEARNIIEQKILCSELNEYQLEILGDYFMEQMHPGELHEIMDERMGGEGSENLRQTHIALGKMFYCGERGTMPRGMMNMMMGRESYGMMEGYSSSYYTQSNYGSSAGLIFTILFSIIIISLLILLIIWLIKQIRK